MKIIKRNGTEKDFDITKISGAISKANSVVDEKDRLTQEQIAEISENVKNICMRHSRAMNVEEIQDLVENGIMAHGAFEVARRYITYRYTRTLMRNGNTTDEKILSLIEYDNENVKQENSNKDPAVNSVQRDYMAGEVSKDLAMRLMLPEDIVKAHKKGLIHFHVCMIEFEIEHLSGKEAIELVNAKRNNT